MLLISFSLTPGISASRNFEVFPFFFFQTDTIPKLYFLPSLHKNIIILLGYENTTASETSIVKRDLFRFPGEFLNTSANELTGETISKMLRLSCWYFNWVNSPALVTHISSLVCVKRGNCSRGTFHSLVDVTANMPIYAISVSYRTHTLRRATIYLVQSMQSMSCIIEGN